MLNLEKGKFVTVFKCLDGDGIEDITVYIARRWLVRAAKF